MPQSMIDVHKIGHHDRYPRTRCVLCRMEKAVKEALRTEVGHLKGMTVEGYIVGSFGEPYSDEDTDGGADNKEPLHSLIHRVRRHDRIDCYVYGYYRDPDVDGGLQTNIEIEFGAGSPPEIVAVRSVADVAALGVAHRLSWRRGT